MKKIITALLLGIIVLNISSCKTEYQEEENHSIEDALKISSYLFDESVEEPLSWDADTVWQLERLKLNEVRLIAPMGAMDMSNFNIFFEFDGMIEIIAEDKDIQLSHNKAFTIWHYMEQWENSGRIFGFSTKIPNQGYIAALPLGAGFGNYLQSEAELFDGYIGREYYLNVNALKADTAGEGTLIVRARLKLVQLKDKSEDSKKSRCFSIELVSYEYSDIYKILEDMPEEEE